MPSPVRPDPTPLTDLLAAARDGEAGASDALARAVYAELHALAAAHLRRERPDHTLQPTALVHEAYLRLVRRAPDGPPPAWRDRAHFFGVAARLMRQILVDHARRTRAAKRGGGVTVTFDDEIAGDLTDGGALEVLRVHEALDALAALDPRQARLVELRFFVGLTLDEAGEVLGVSRATAVREWAMARAWLATELRG